MLGPEAHEGEDRGGSAQMTSQELERRVARVRVSLSGVHGLLNSLVVDGGPALLGSVPCVPAFPARWNGPISVIVHVLAKKTGLVSGVVQPGGDGAVLQSLIAELCPSPQGELVAVDVGVVSVLPARDGSPCRAAQRVCGGHVDELNALADDVFVQGRHRVFGSRELIVGKDEDYVGPLDR